ncbi:MAG: GtrA family protein [Gammaproteobacteria bacterium]|nr:GtrA family protein [Gammaproteobacteria bacterium]
MAREIGIWDVTSGDLDGGAVSGFAGLNAEFARYFFASALAFLIDAGSLFLLTQYAGIHYLTSAALGFLLGLVAVYILSVRWVFTTRRLQNNHHEMMLFAAIGIGGLGINELGMFLATEVLALYYMISKVLVAASVFAWNFTIRKLLLFR